LKTNSNARLDPKYRAPHKDVLYGSPQEFDIYTPMAYDLYPFTLHIPAN